MPSPPEAPPRQVGRYTLHREIAAGGMASVHFGTLQGPQGFSRVVAIKRMRPSLASDPKFVEMFVDEALLASRVHHPNVVATLDVVHDSGEILIVMDYVRGASLAHLLTEAGTSRSPIPIAVAASIVTGALAGLHAAHEARDRRGKPLGLVHRDVSPQNVLVGEDGVARIMDFGIAKATQRLHTTQDGTLKGKLSYMAPEQLQGADVDRRADVFAMAVLFWGALAGRRLFRGNDVAETMTEVLRGDVPPLADFRPEVPQALEAVIRKSLARERGDRHATALDFVGAIEAAIAPAPARDVATWVRRIAAPLLAEREAMVASIEDTGVEAGPLPPAPSLDLSTRVDRPRDPPEPTESSLPTLERPGAPADVDGDLGNATASSFSTARIPLPEPALSAPPAGRPRAWHTTAVVAGIVAGLVLVGAFALTRGAPAPAASASPPESATPPTAVVAAPPASATAAVADEAATSVPAPTATQAPSARAPSSRPRGPRPAKPRVDGLIPGAP